MPKLFIGNWKMYLSDAVAERLAGTYLEAAEAARCEIAVAPSFTALDRVSRAAGRSKIGLAAQDVFWTDGGAYTGEVSPPMLKALGIRYVILGHSERRAYLGETDAMVSKKAQAAAAHGLVPVVCVGETAEEKERGKREAVVRGQLEAAIEHLHLDDEHPLVVAYEPRWAIGTGVPCRVEDVAVMHGLIRETVEAMKNSEALNHLRVLYGGSVDAKNIAEYVGSPAVDGALVGGASTKPDQIASMIAAFA